MNHGAPHERADGRTMNDERRGHRYPSLVGSMPSSSRRASAKPCRGRHHLLRELAGLSDRPRRLVDLRDSTISTCGLRRSSRRSARLAFEELVLPFMNYSPPSRRPGDQAPDRKRTKPAPGPPRDTEIDETSHQPSSTPTPLRRCRVDSRDVSGRGAICATVAVARSHARHSLRQHWSVATAVIVPLRATTWISPLSELLAGNRPTNTSGWTPVPAPVSTRRDDRTSEGTPGRLSTALPAALELPPNQ